MINEKIGNIFYDSEPWETFFMPISADYELSGANIILDRMFGVQRALQERGYHLFPDALLVGGAVAVITKPRRESAIALPMLQKSLQICSDVCKREGIKHLAMIPLRDDSLPWPVIRRAVSEELKDVTVTVYRKEVK
jgi:hypothetical protein